MICDCSSQIFKTIIILSVLFLITIYIIYNKTPINKTTGDVPIAPSANLSDGVSESISNKLDALNNNINNVNTNINIVKTETLNNINSYEKNITDVANAAASKAAIIISAKATADATASNAAIIVAANIATTKAAADTAAANATIIVAANIANAKAKTRNTTAVNTIIENFELPKSECLCDPLLRINENNNYEKVNMGSRNQSYIHPRIPGFQLFGIIINKNLNSAYNLYGRRTYYRSNEYDYYIDGNIENTQIKIPLLYKKELFDKDIVKIPELHNNEYTVTLYDKEKLYYIPY